MGGRPEGWRSGENARLPSVCPEFDFRTRRHMCLEPEKPLYNLKSYDCGAVLFMYS